MTKISWICECGVSKDSLKSVDYYNMTKRRNLFENDEDFMELKLIGNGALKFWFTPFPIEQIAKYQR